MARYIDADALEEYIQETICAKCGDISDGIKCKSCGIDDTLDFLENAPTADVVPKSEVKNLQDELDLYEFVYGVTPDKQKVIGRVRSDVAREVFEKIEDQLRGMFDHFRQNYDVRESGAIIVALSQIAELKMKYTEK